ncbi:MAG TPA: NAD(P)H-dependent oxidoreductase [Pseudomonadales bacterium]
MPTELRSILHLDASHRRQGSVSRGLSQLLVDELLARHPAARIVRRDLASGMPLVDDAWIEASFTPADQRSNAQRRALAHSDTLVEELRTCDVWVIGTPIYNFGIPPLLKAWIDQICRARVTFAYTEQGPRGLLEDRPVFVTIASGGSQVGSEREFLTPYLRHVLGFIGIRDLRIIAADQLLVTGEAKIELARQQIRDAAAGVRLDRSG